jgi:intraflagellar transport protein 56
MKGLTDEKEIGITWLNIACCYFALGMYSKAAEAVERGQGSDLEARLLFHLAHKLGQEDTVMERHAALQETTANLLSLASIHYLRADFQSAIDIYKKMLLTNRLVRVKE